MATIYVGKTETYTTLQSAIDAAAEGDSIILKEDITENSIVIDGKDLSIDLGGFTFTGRSIIKNGADVTFDNGKMTVSTA